LRAATLSLLTAAPLSAGSGGAAVSTGILIDTLETELSPVMLADMLAGASAGVLGDTFTDVSAGLLTTVLAEVSAAAVLTGALAPRDTLSGFLADVSAAETAAFTAASTATAVVLAAADATTATTKAAAIAIDPDIRRFKPNISPSPRTVPSAPAA
jgi:hypothetical protein